MNFPSQLPNVQKSIFGIMSQKAADFNAINLSQGFPDFNPDEKLIDLANHFMKQGHNQYAPMSGALELRKAISAKVQLYQNTYYDPHREITVTAGATQALATAISIVVKPGDEIIVFEPTYDAYIPLIELNGGRAVPLELAAPDFKPNWQQLKDSINNQTKAIILNFPHNPSGALLSHEDLNELAQIIKDKDIYIISDEVYEHITFDQSEHISLATHPILKNSSFVISSFGKTLHATGWKCGYCLAPEVLTNEFQKAHQFMVYSVSTFTQMAIAEYLKSHDYSTSVDQLYQQKRDLVLQSISQSSFSAKPTKSTYFQLIDYSDLNYSDGISLCNELVEKHGLALIPLEPFYKHFDTPSLIRICFAKTDQTLTDGLKILQSL